MAKLSNSQRSAEFVKKNKKKENSTSTLSNSRSYSNSERSRIYQQRYDIGLNTLSSDLDTLSKSVSNAYSGWQSRETMQNTLSSMQSMYERLGKYQEYSKTYGGTDLTELRNTYKGIIDDWDSLSRKYNGYDNAEAYNKAVSDSKALYEKQSSADIGALQTEIDGLEDILKNVEAHQSNIRGLETKRNTWEHRSNGLKTDMGYGSKVAEAQTELDKYLKSVGYDSVDALKKDLGNKKVFKTQAEKLQNLNSLSSVGDKTSKNYDKDFEKYVASGQSIPTDEVGTSKRRKPVGHGRTANTPKANDDLREVALAFERKQNGQTSSNSDSYYDRGAIFDLMTDEEFNNFYYYLGKDKEDGGNKAQEYVDAIAESLNFRRGEQIAKLVEDKPWGELGFSIEAGLDQWSSGIDANLSNKNYIPTSAMQYASGIVRENIEYEHGKFARTMYDLGVTGANQLPSILVSTALGTMTGGVGGVAGKVLSGVSKGAGLAAMGISARGNAYQEMLSLGYDKDQASTYANLVAISETGLQALLGGIGKLGGTNGKIAKLVEGIDNGFARFAIQWGGSVASEATEEGLQEILNPLFQNIAAGYDTGAEVDWSEVAYSALLGGLMGGMFEGLPLATNSIAEHSHNKALGKDIKANDRVAEVFDIANNPDIADAYDTYTRYANKGVTTENISDVQLGRLYNKAKTETVETLTSKKSTTEQKENALKRLAEMSIVETENVVAKEKKNLNIGEETTVTESGETVNVKDLKVKGKDIVVTTEKGEVSVDDMTIKDKDADLVALARIIAREDGEDVANLFISQYDGETDVNAYANSFNLAKEYAKHNFPQETILENKGVLSAPQVNAIYQSTVINEANARETELKNFAEKQGKTMTIQGVFDDSIIDYNSSTTDDSKVNWNSLTTTQRAAIKFTKLFSKATGVNIKFIKSNVKDGKHQGKNGSYDPATNTIEIDVYAGRIDAASVKDSIIPTLSHEITHWMKAKSPSVYNSIKEDIIKTLKQGTGQSSETIINKELNRLNKNHPEKKHTVDEAIDEIVARACEDMLSNSNAARKLLNKMSKSEQQSFIAKVKETFENLMQWVNDLLAHYKSTSEEAKVLREYKYMLKKISKQWDEMLANSIETNQALEKSGAVEQKSDALKLSIRAEYSNEIEMWRKEGMPEGENFILGTTGDVLQGLGAIESDIYMLGDKIKEIITKHPEMSISEIKKIPQILENPVLILKSLNETKNNTRMVIYGNVMAQDGKPILSVLDLRPIEKNLVVDDMQKVSSAYTKDSNPVDFIRKSLIVYADKKRTTKLLKSIGFEMPIELLQSGYIGSISYFKRSVNINGEEFSKVFKENKEFNSDREQSVYDLMGETERVVKENEKFKAEIERLKERLAIERKVTKGNYFNENQLGAVAGHLRNISKSNIDKIQLMKALKDVYSHIAHSENLAWEDVFERCYRIAESMIAEAKPLTISDDYSKALLKEIRGTRISLDETQKQEAKSRFGKNWNNHFMGKVVIANDGINIDTKWQEWSRAYPDVFDADINSNDMISELYDIIDSLKESSEVIDTYSMEEQTRWLANEIYNQYWNVSPIRTTADKYDKRIKQLNFEHRRAMTELRDDYNTRLKEQHKVDREKQKKLVSEIRERKDSEIALAKQHGREMMSKYKENAERKTAIQRVTANALSLNEMLVKNSKDKHIPEIMKGPVTSLLQAIDFSSKRMLEKGEPTQKDISLSKSLSKVKDMMVKATNAHEELVELYGHGLDEDIEKMVDSVDDIMRTVGDNEFVLNKMSLADLQTLDKMVKTIKHAVNKLNKFHTVNHAKGIANLSQESIVYLDSLGKGKVYDGIRGKSSKLLNWGNALPYYVFKRYGSGGIKVYEALQNGWDKFAFNTKAIMDYANESYTSKEVNEWSEEVKTFKILIPATEESLADENYQPQYQEVQLTVPQIMSMYCLNKREQARGHLFKGGIRVADFKTEKGEIVSQSEGVIFTEKDIAKILNSLTDRQKSVADKLQRFMNDVCADWGNDVSMARFGYKAFGEPNYFPIQSDKNNLAVNDETEQPNSLFRLLNMSFTKVTEEKANNRIVISDIFDVFAQHTSDMAKYNALALPVLDAFKWYNYTEKQDIAEGTFKTSGVKQSIESAFGKDGQSYFTTFLKDINGQQEVSRDTLGNGFFKNAKIAAVGANLRVVLLQPTSYVRASAVIDNKYLSKALIHKPKIAKAETHCGIALWKSMGYYDTNIQKGLEAQIKHADTWKDKAVDLSMKGAEWADKITWGYLWNACELEVRDIRKDLKVGSQEFYDAIAKRLREVIYATQVVDSTMTRSQMMRSSDGRDKLLTAFASEPTLSYNMLQDAYFGYQLDARRFGKGEAIKKHRKRIARVLFAYTMTNAVAALVESAFDALRDDDDEEMDMALFMKYYFSNFASDMSITAKIPYVKEFHSFIQGFSSSRTDTQWMENITKSMTYFYKLAQGKGKPSTGIKYSLKAISDLFGIPIYNVYRDAMATLNKLDLFTAEDLNEMFGDFFD